MACHYIHPTYDFDEEHKGVINCDYIIDVWGIVHICDELIYITKQDWDDYISNGKGPVLNDRQVGNISGPGAYYFEGINATDNKYHYGRAAMWGQRMSSLSGEVYPQFDVLHDVKFYLKNRIGDTVMVYHIADTTTRYALSHILLNSNIIPECPPGECVQLTYVYDGDAHIITVADYTPNYTEDCYDWRLSPDIIVESIMDGKDWYCDEYAAEVREAQADGEVPLSFPVWKDHVGD